jgi:hypothetical protein
MPQDRLLAFIHKSYIIIEMPARGKNSTFGQFIDYEEKSIVNTALANKFFFYFSRLNFIPV